MSPSQRARTRRLSLMMTACGALALLVAVGLVSGWLPSPSRNSTTAAGASLIGQSLMEPQPAELPTASSDQPPPLPGDDVAPPPAIDVAPVLPAPSPSNHAARAAAQFPVHLHIADLKLDTPVVTTTTVGGVWQVASNAAGYLQGSGLLGQAGNVALAGHDDIQGAVFRQLKIIKPGTAIEVTSADRRYHYTVDRIRYVGPSDTSVIAPTSDARLTLITCWPDFFTPKAAYNSLRLVVQARLVS